MKVIIPTSLKEITCLQLNEILEANKLIDNEMMLKIKVISIVTNVPLEKVAEFPINDINEIASTIFQILQEKPEIESFKIDGVEFGFIPDIETIKGNQYLDLEMYIESDMFKAMAVMYRPIVRKKNELYKIEKYKGADKYSELMKKAPASAYIGAKVFFSTLAIDLLSVTPAYLLKNLTSSEAALLEKNGVGISQLTNSLEEIGYDLKKLLQN
jgi:hypothetical protein